MASPHARTWVLLRGFTREAGHWGEFLNVFQAQNPHDKILPLDLPGAGLERDIDSPLSISEITEFVRKRLNELHPHEGQIHLLAISLGGMVASEWIAQDPGKIAAAVIINTSSSGLNPILERFSLKALLRFFFLPFFHFPKIRETVILRLTSNSSEKRKKAYPRWLALQKKNPISMRQMFRQLRAGAKYRVREIPPHIPVLLLTSTNDRLVNPNCSERLRDFWKVDLVYHPSAGHDIPLDDPEWLATTIHNWLSLISSSQAAQA